ncbi:MAG TPA: FecR domain-containing protein [Myxococcaceae bacterium]|nr:FecR domain-containing protein [Myxococcaceae bacterium]
MFPRTAHAFLSCLLLVAACDLEEEPLAEVPAAAGQGVLPVEAGEVPLARLEALSGEVRLERKGELSPAGEGPLWSGDAVETGPDGSATVRFSDGRTVEVGPEARFLLGEDEGGVVVEVARGFILSRVPAAATRPEAGPRVELTIRTPFGLTRVGAGESEVKVGVGEDESRVEVRLGSVEVVAKTGQVMRASEGKTLAVKAEGVEERLLELASIQVTVHADTGRAEWRQKGSTRWRVVRRGGAPLKPGDGVRVRRGKALLKLEGSESTLALGGGGELVVEGAGQGDSADEARVELRRGSLEVQLASGRASRVVLPGLSLEGSGAARLDVRRTSYGFTVDSRAGDVVLVRGEVREPLRAGERATVKKGEDSARVEAVEPAPLALPPAEGQQVFHRRLREVALTWEGEEEARVEVAADSRFERPVLEGLARRGFVNVPVPFLGRLYWRVRRQDGTEVARGSASFAPERPPRGELDRLRNRVPEGPEKTTIFFQDKPPAITFTAEPEPGAASYKVTVYRSGALGQPVAERTASTSQVPLEAGILGEGSYLWSISPLASGGKPLRGGRMSRLELVFDNSVPTLVVSSPREGQRVGSRVRVEGLAPVGARLSVNGRSISLDSKHRFDAWVTPVGRPPTVLFKMSRPGASDLYVVRTLK